MKSYFLTLRTRPFVSSKRHVMPFRHAQRGAVTLLVALSLPVLLGVAALVVDVAYLQLVRIELQNDADAAALAGAKHLYLANNAAPQWATAEQRAQQAIALNAADGKKLSTGIVQSGYWNPQNSSAQLQLLPVTPTGNDVPALQVTLSKGQGQNDGEVPNFFARLWNHLSTPITVTAVAGVTSPGSIKKGGLFPLVASQCVYDTYWNANSKPPSPALDPLTGAAFVLVLMAFDDKPTDPCKTFQWSSLLNDSNDVGSFRTLVADRNPEELSIGDKIWIEPGSKATLFDTVNDCSAAKDKKCEFVTLPMVSSIAAHQDVPISSFACARILSADKPQKTISIQLSNTCPQPPSGGVGPNFGVVSPPSLLR